MGYKKGQAAMEYLMTYGWAILIIVVVLAILAFYLPQLIRAPESCLFTSQGFSCMEETPAIYYNETEDTVRVSFRLDNQQGKEVILKRVACTNIPIGDINKEFIEGGSYSDIGGDKSIPAGGSEYIDVYCVDKNGEPVSLSPGSEFRGVIAITYNYRDDLAPTARTATATLSGPVLGE